MKKSLILKIGIAVLAVIVLVAGIFIYKAAQPKPQEGAKAYTLQITLDGQNIEKELTGRTDAAYLSDLLAELNLQPVYDASGTFLSGICGYTPNADAHEFLSLYTSDPAFIMEGEYTEAITAFNNVECKTASKGVKELALKDGETYVIRLATW